MNGRQLRVVFQQFNQQYFGGRLPSYHVRVVHKMPLLFRSGRIVRRRRLIEVQKDEDNPIATLLHEMVHAVTNNFHAAAFTREMKRLIDAGAPVGDCERNTVALCPVGQSVTMSRREITSHFDDALMDDQTATFPEIVRWIISSYGGPSSVTAFSRRYPWALKLFRKRKKMWLDEQKRADEFRAKLAEAKGKA